MLGLGQVPFPGQVPGQVPLPAALRQWATAREEPPQPFAPLAPSTPAGYVELQVKGAFEECLKLEWTATPESARLVECSVELVLDRSPPGDADQPPPAPLPNAMVKRVECNGDTSVTIQNMPTGRRFIVSVVGQTAYGAELRSTWVRAACLRPDRRPLGTSNRDPFSVPRLKCKNCTCAGYLLSFDLNSSMAKSSCRRCSCRHEDHEPGGAACPELRGRMEAYCQRKGVKSCAPLPEEAMDWSEEECELWFEHKGAIHPRNEKGKELLRARAAVAAASAATPSSGPEAAPVRGAAAEAPLGGEGGDVDGLVEAALHLAAEWILRADAIVVGCGGRMGEWREEGEEEPSAPSGAEGGPQEGEEEEAAAAQRQASSEPSEPPLSHIDPRWFDEDPALAWGYWLDCRSAFKELRPHTGHEVVRSWAKRAPLGSFCFASGASTSWQAAGWPLDQLVEPDGWYNCLQCVGGCGQDPWTEPEDLELGVEPESHRAIGVFPTCPSCGSNARPGVRFPTGDQHLENPWMLWQQANLGSWCERTVRRLESERLLDGSGEGDQVLLLDLGCAKGSGVRTLLGQAANAFPRCGKIIHLDPQDTRDARIGSGSLSVPISVPAALRRLRAIVSAQEAEMASFIFRDPERSLGAEVTAFADAPMRHVFRRALAAVGNTPVLEEEQKFKVMHVHAQGYTKDLGPRDIIPDSFLFVRYHGDGEEPPVTFVDVSGVRFLGRNAQLVTRIERVARLLADLLREFSQPDYQKRLKKAEDRATLQKLIREVHLRVLRLHDFPIEGADSRLQQELVMQMQGFLHTGMVTPENNEMGNQTLELSGYSRMPKLPARKGPKNGESVAEPAAVPSGRPAWKRNASRATCVILLRHGQREDYVALGEGRGQDWVAQNQRPWDPMLAEAGRKQAQAAAKRIREVLEENDLPAPTRIFSSPYARCVETAQIAAQELGLKHVLLEDGLMEAVCEAWMRQWAVPGAEGRWGGPEHAMMSEAAMSSWQQTVQGPDYATQWIRPEALGGVAGLLWTPDQLAQGMGGPGSSMVHPRHKSCISMRGRGYCWGHFERKEDMEQRVVDTIHARAAQNPARTLVFVSHGGPTMHAFKTLTGSPIPKGSGGMASVSVLRKLPSRSWHWDALLSNDAQHSEAFHVGVQ